MGTNVEIAERELAVLAARLGAPRFCQGAGGNVSVKLGGELWVKASGVRLADVVRDHGVSRVSLEVARAAAAGDIEAERLLFEAVPRPSLETLFHALEGAVVAHTHALGILLVACSKDPSSLGDIPVVPYARPGRELADAVARARSHLGREGILILRSHGVIAYAETSERAVEMTEALDSRARARFSSLPDFEELLLRYRVAGSASISNGTLRLLPARSRPAGANGRYLFPDAPVCATEIEVEDLAAPHVVAASVLESIGRTVLLVDRHGRRAIAGRSDRSVEFGLEVTAAHDWLEDVLVPTGSASYLPEDEPAKLVDMPSEQYRIRLAAVRKDPC